MNIDNRVSQLNTAVFQRLQDLQLQPGQTLETEQARQISDAMLADGEVSADELDLVNEILSQQAQASHSDISVQAEATPFEPLSLNFAAVSPGAQADLHRMQAASEAAPADWGDVTIAQRQSNIRELSALASSLSEQGVPGVELWGQLTDAAVAQYADAHVDAARKSDFVMQDLGVVLLGPMSMRGLDAYEHMTGWIPGDSDPMVDSFRSDLVTLGLPPTDGNWEAAGFAKMGLDKNAGEDFRPQINDGTNNQIYHTFFYQYESYVTRDPVIVNLGSMYHETVDGGLLNPGGKTSEDNNAAYVGNVMGLGLRAARDGEGAEAALANWGEVTLAAYGRDGGPDVRAGTASPAAENTHEVITDMLEGWSNPGLRVVRGAQNLVIDQVVGRLGRWWNGE